MRAMPPLQDRPVFLDRRGRRAIATNLVLLLLAAIAAIGLTAVVLGVVVAPHLPALTAPTVVSAGPGDLPLARAPGAEPALVPTRNRYVSQDATSAMRLAYFSQNDVGSFQSLKRNAGKLDGLIPDWLLLDEAGGRVAVRSTASEEVIGWLRTRAPHMAIYPFLASRLNPARTEAAFASPGGRALLIDQLAKHLRQDRFGGIVLDLSGMRSSGHAHLVTFLGQLRAVLKARGQKVILAAPPQETGQRLQLLSKFVDYILVLSHDETAERSDPGPVASQGWFEEEVWSRLPDVPAGKLIISIGAFGYDFDAYGKKRSISVQEAWLLLDRSGADLTFDSRSLNPTFIYRGDDGRRHQVWFLDAVTAFNQTKAAMAVRPAGLAISSLGLEDPGVWEIAARNKHPNAAAMERLKTPEAGYGSFAETRGALIAASTGTAGTRTLSFSRSLGLIVDETLTGIPRQAKLTEWLVKDPMAVALTFDDGPHPVYTPQILDILSARNAKATFYVIGRNAVAYPDVLTRVYKDGHDIGNHTFSHANIFNSSSERIAAELNATQRVFEDQLGARTVLFRPPFASAGYEFLETSFTLAETSSRLGYLIGGPDVNPLDYLTTADRIVDQVVSQIVGGRGRIVILHDAGGNRGATIEALPRIIDKLQSAGFRFVTTHELVGLRSEDVMPLAPRDAAVWAQAAIRSGSVSFVAWLSNVLPSVAIATAIIGLLRLILVVIGAIAQARRSRSRAPDQGFQGTITAIVPAYNEEAVICKTVRGLLASSMGDRIKVLVIDDGSTDRTSDVVIKGFANDERVEVFRKSNGGKASALNHGISRTDADVVVAIDGDTILLPDAIECLVARFADPAIGAVAGRVVVGNRINLMTRFQALEYITSQNLDRRAFELFNAIGVVPGAIGAWRRQAIIEAGGYSRDTLAEDADLTVTLERLGWRVVDEPAAQALTEAPETLRAFMKQRYRWMFGTLQGAFKHADVLLKRPSGLSMITIPNIIIFQFLFTVLSPAMDVVLLFAIVLTLASFLVESQHQVDNIIIIAKYWIVFQAADVLAAMIGVALNKGSHNWRLIPLIPVQRFSYRQLLYVTAIRALLSAIKGTFVGWGKLLRTGNVAAPIPRIQVESK